MNKNIQDILRTSDNKREIYFKNHKKFWYMVFFFGVLYVLFLLFIPNPIILLWSFIILSFISIVFTSMGYVQLQKFKRDISEKVGVMLIKISISLDKYAENVEPGDLILANKRLNSVISWLSMTLTNLSADTSFDTSNREFIIKLKKYLKFEVSNVLSSNTNSDIQSDVVDDLQHLGVKIYSKDFKGAEVYLDKHKKYSNSKKLLHERMIDLFTNTTHLSKILSIIIVLGALIYLLKYKPSSIDEIYKIVIIFIGGGGIYISLRGFIKSALDALFGLMLDVRDREGNKR